MPAPVQLGLKTAVPARWLIVDLETGTVYGSSEVGLMEKVA